MQGRATLAGHPIHPALVTVPIGCFVAAIVADIVSIWAGAAFWTQMSTWLIGFGLVGALVAAFFGFVDYLSAPMSAQAKGIAAWHMTLIIGVVVIFGTAFALRYGDYNSYAGHLLTIFGIVVLAVAGFLGGNLAHNHLVGSTEADVSAPREAADESALSEEERLTRYGTIDPGEARKRPSHPVR